MFHRNFKHFIILCLIKQLIIILCVSGRQTDRGKSELFTEEQLKNLAESVCSDMGYIIINLGSRTCQDSYWAPDTSMTIQPSGVRIRCHTSEGTWFQVDPSESWQLVVLVPQVTNHSQTDMRLNYVIVDPMDEYKMINTTPLRNYTIWSTILEEGIPVEWQRGEKVPEFNQPMAPEHRTYEIKNSIFCHSEDFEVYGQFTWNISRDTDVCFGVVNSCKATNSKSTKVWVNITTIRLNRKDQEPQIVFDHLLIDDDCDFNVTGLYGTTQLHYRTAFCVDRNCTTMFYPETPDDVSVYMEEESVYTWVVNVDWAPPDCPPDSYNVTLTVDSIRGILVKTVGLLGNATKAKFSTITSEELGNFHVVIQAKLGEETKEMAKTLIISDRKKSNLYIKVIKDSVGTWNVNVKWPLPYVNPDSYMVTLVADTNQTKVLPGNATTVVFNNVTGKGTFNVTLEEKLGNITRVFTTRAKFRGEELVGNRGTAVVIVAGATCVGAVVALALLFYFRRLSHRAPVPPVKPSRCSEPEDRWEVRADRLTLHEVIGEGAFGIVHRATLAPQCVQVAVKMLKCFATLDEIRAFHSEIELMKNVGVNPHVVSLVGYCSGRKPFIIVEYCSRGDLLSYLRSTWDVMLASKRNVKHCNIKDNSGYRNDLFKCKTQMKSSKVIISKFYEHQEICDTELTALDLLSFCRQIAIGMEFLAANKVVHRDLAARNILMTADRTLKISDFGLSRDVYEANQYTQKSNGKMPVKWLALESLTRAIYTTQSDVWSFGVVVFEIVTVGEAPYAAVPVERLPRLLRSGYRMPKPNNCSPQLYDIMLSCWRTHPHERPSFAELHQRFDELLSSACDNQYLTLEKDAHDSPPTLALEIDADNSQPRLALEIDADDAQPTLVLEIDVDNAQSMLALEINADDAQPTLALEIDADDAQPPLALEIDVDNAQSMLALEINAENAQPTLALEIDADDAQPTLVLEINADDAQPPLALEIDADDVQPTLALEIDADNAQPPLVLEIDADDAHPTFALEIDTDDAQPPLALELDADDTQPTLALEIDADDAQPPLALQIKRL